MYFTHLTKDTNNFLLLVTVSITNVRINFIKFKPMKIEIACEFKHTRNIDDKDKFFIVKMILDNKYNCDVGWIEKSFIKKDFIKKFPFKKFNKIEIMDVIEFTDIKKYNRYKLENGM